MEHEVNPNEGPVKRKRGRPKKVQTPDMRQPLRDALREDEAFVYQPSDVDGPIPTIPKEIIPDGMEYLWVTASIYGQSQPQRLSRFQKQGWQPVPASRHDGLFMPKGHPGPIEVDGLMLHERPKKICDLARAHEYKKARAQIKAKEDQLLGGGGVDTAFDSQHPSALRSNKIEKSYERIKIEDD